MKTNEMTDRDLLAYIDEQIGIRMQTLAHGQLDEAPSYYFDRYHERAAGQWDGRRQARGEEYHELMRLQNLLKLGMRCIDGELPELGDRPWDERDEKDDGKKAVADFHKDVTARAVQIDNVTGKILEPHRFLEKVGAFWREVQ